MKAPSMKPRATEAVAAFAENMIKSYADTGGDLAPIFAAFIALVHQRDKQVGSDCLTALDQWISDERYGRAKSASPSA